MQYSTPQLRILWYLKKYGPMINPGPYVPGREEGIIATLSTELFLTRGSIQYNLNVLEKNCIVCRTSLDPSKRGKGWNPMIRLELIDPTMWLPEEPAPIPLGTIMAIENEELRGRTVEEPSMERTLAFVLDRMDEYKHQIDTLRDRLIAVDHENEELKRKLAGITNHRNRPAPDPLKHRVAEHLTAEEWDALYHPPREN